MEDRIKLAVAMGWERADDEFGPDTWIQGVKGRVIANAPGTCRDMRDELPNPFTDANDDYAVLEWMRTQDRKMFRKFYWALRDAAKNRDYANPGARRFTMAATQYKIGDYARAALKVIE